MPILRLVHLRAAILALLVAGCGATGPTQCNPVLVNTASRVLVRDSAGTELARGWVVVQRADGDSIAWFRLTVYSESGPSPLLGHVRAAALLDARGVPVFVPELEQGLGRTAESTMPLRDAGAVADLRRRLERDTLRLELATDLATYGILRSPITYDSAASVTRAPFCFAPCGRFQFCD